MTATQKFDKGGKPKKEEEDQEERVWGGQEDVDKLCAVFVTFLSEVKHNRKFFAPSDSGEASVATDALN